MNFSAATELCSESPILDALAVGISHTDVGLTTATIFLTFATLTLMDERRFNRIKKNLTPHVPHFKVSRSVKVTRTITSADGASTKDEAEASETVEE